MPIVQTMSGAYPRQWKVGGPPANMDADTALCRLWDALGDCAENMTDWDAVEPIVNPLLDILVDAGYVEAWGHSPTGCASEIRFEGHERLRALGRHDA
jgi:hypothetical protein